MDSKPTTIITPPKGLLSIDFQGVWRYRDLLWLLAKRDISTRFRQSLLGYGWAVLRPGLTALIFTVVFSLVLRVETDIPYPIYAFSGLMPWLFFANTISTVTNSVVSSSHVLTKVYFPRLILPIAPIGVGVIEFAIQLLVMVGILLWFGLLPQVTILLAPVVLLATVIVSLAFGIWFTALNVRFRDIGMAVPFLVQIWMYLCPIIYPITMVPEQYRLIYALNPMVSVIESFRWCIYRGPLPDWEVMLVGATVTLVVLIGGLIFFRNVENKFADII